MSEEDKFGNKNKDKDKNKNKDKDRIVEDDTIRTRSIPKMIRTTFNILSTSSYIDETAADFV